MARKTTLIQGSGLLPLILSLPLPRPLEVAPPWPRTSYEILFRKERNQNERDRCGRFSGGSLGPSGVSTFLGQLHRWLRQQGFIDSLTLALSDGWLGLATRSTFSASHSTSFVCKSNLIVVHMILSVLPPSTSLPRFHELLCRARQHQSLSRCCSVPSAL